MATRRNGLPEVWVTHAAKFLVGDVSCPYQGWFKAHHSKYTKEPSSFDTVAWKAAHTALLHAEVAMRVTNDWKCRTEQVVRVQGTKTVIIGKVDIIGQKPGVTKVTDVKSGKPKDADAAQVAIYMVLLPLAWEQPTLHVTGEVVYATGQTVSVEPHDALELKPRLFAYLRAIAETQPSPYPSETGCKFCDITIADCDQKMGAVPVVTTELF